MVRRTAAAALSGSFVDARERAYHGTDRRHAGVPPRS
jgi:hypothetical protein